MKLKQYALRSSAIAVAFLLPVAPFAASAQEETSAEEARQETVFITGRRVSTTDEAIGLDEATNTVAVTREELLSAPSGISGLKMLESLPGFNVQTDGALGLYEFGNSVTVRAFNLQQIGFVLDGVPMGRSDAFGGSPIFRYVDNENLGSVVASPGAGDVSLPSYASLGPIVSYNTVAPSDEAGGMIAYTIGDDNLERSFIKLETGDLNGLSAYISRSKTDSDLWRGPGSIDREHIEGKVVYEFDADTILSAGYVANEFFDYDSPSGPESLFEDDYYYGYLPAVPDSCIDPQPGVYDYNGDGTVDGDDFTPVFTDSSCTQYYEDRINIRQDALYRVSFETDLTEGLDFKATYYFEDKDGFGVSPDSYGNSLGIYLDQAEAGLDVVWPRGVQYGLSEVGGEREGVVGGLTWAVANHTVEAGVWYEDETYNRTQQRLNKTAGSADGDVLFDEVAYYRRDYTTQRETVQLYLKDTISLMDDRLNVEVGIKSLQVDYSLDGYRDYNDYEIDGEPGYGPQSIDAEYEDNFLPMIGAVYDLNPNDQIFASYSQNYALPRGADDIFDNATATPLPAPEGEESENFEIGLRTNRPSFYGAASLYYTAFDNRLLESSVINPATGQPEAFYINGGETTAYGVELSGVYQPDVFNDQLYFTGNLTYNKSEDEDGFTLADSPEWLVTGGLTYEPTTWLIANISGKHTSERYATFTETGEMEAFTVFDGYLDIGGPNDFGLPENVGLRLNVSNIFDEEVPTAFVFAGSAFYRPLNPRTFQATLTVHF
ncbi:MAG: TonB-dependent receptor [Henriciella sp.]|jgi:iron complex outermembrane receptor protein|uniref:TonB-dependent receptor n=1 Tax=Henriciella sp. TaxID=1968823 RepID=UPI000C0D7649|nr:TonB-dependent receptor [Henriciella sp.]MAN74566.1 TonB-dependent receptor [Henriciella sp.]PHR81849.1 MAG: TonB-dependent receptor [Henriciella sp.]|tara:strand:- start:12347 stop:14668 length:2322 start_codon:yes stop_codon:yes gene_type:complete